MEAIDIFKKLRDVSNEMVEALEVEDSQKTEVAMGKFLVLMMQLEALK
ncbi:hypothetical protein [Desulfosporosinus sp.]|nr:hypothetical protein [Desulfosporosinus sp.]MBC2721813.1 hypothetical protein [Desulfosporosinus sp.]MBC2726283.1 hypothetical protein [Desulfosporosinus sp.]